MKHRKKRIAVKIGSNVLTRSDGTLNITQMSALVDQVAELHKMGYEILLISSGAVASGRSVLKPHKKLDTVSARQLYSATGQAILIHRYNDLFLQQGLFCGQILTTKEDFATRRHYLNQKNCIETMLSEGVIPIVNENDTISVTELMFTDNDELSGLIASMLDCDQLIILSNIDGIYTGDPSNPESKLIWAVENSDTGIEQHIQTNKSSFGRGGMLTKYHIAQKVANEGIEVIIANGKKDGILLLLQDELRSCPCTRFIPSEKRVHSVKKWIAHSTGYAKGKIYLNEGASNAVQGSQAVSILAVGIDKVEGSFEADDLVRILDHHHQVIGIGKISFDSTQAIENIGKKGIRPYIHYNYLYLD